VQQQEDTDVVKTTSFVCGGIGSDVHGAANIDFIVFFLGPNPEKLDPEQWRVTREGANVIAEYARLYREEGDGAYVLLSGHDQKFGSEQNALVRSQRRADAVRHLLIEYGVPARVVSTKACGWSRQIVVTGSDR
jgi:hypothetical protein